MNVLKDEKNTVRRIIQLRLEALGWSKIHEILNVDQETAKRYFDKNINKLENFRAERSQPKIVFKNEDHVSAFGIRYETRYVLALQVIPHVLNDWRRTKKENDILNEISEKHRYSRCVQLYLEGLEKEEISQLLNVSSSKVGKILTDKEFHKHFGVEKPATYKLAPFDGALTHKLGFGRHIFFGEYSNRITQREKLFFFSRHASSR